MHEATLMRDVVGKVEQVAEAAGAQRVTGVRVYLGALSHFDEAHFREHFVDATRGTIAEGARVEVDMGEDPLAHDADRVLLESIEIED